MFVPKWYWNHVIEKQNELERRVKRLELMLLKDAENKMASLRDGKTGAVSRDGILPIEEIISRKERNK